MNKSLSEYNNQNKKLLNAMQAEGMKSAIDFAPRQRSKYAETGTTATSNGDIPSEGQQAKTKGFFRKIG